MLTRTIDPFSFKTQPFGHQAEELVRSAEDKSRALFWEQGTGKTKYGIDATAHNRRLQKIAATIVVAPGGVERNWITDEFPTHWPDDLPYRAHVFESKKANARYHQKAVADLLLCYRELPVLAMSYDAWLTDAGKQAAWDLMRSRPTFIHFDESAHLKNFSSVRTKSITKAAPYAAMSRIYSGTPVDNSPFDVYSQVSIVDPTFWARELNLTTFTDFKAFFGIFIRESRKDGRDYPVCVAYQNISILRDLLKKIGSRVLKDDVLDLPEKLYTKRYYEMTPKQRSVYEQLENEYATQLDAFDEDSWVTAELPIVRMTRLQQVLCGYVPADEDEGPRELIEPGATNPRIEATVGFLMEAGNQQTGCWAMYRKDVDMLMDRLIAEGRKPVRYDGAVSEEDRAKNKLAFQKGDASDFVGNLSVGAEGLTLVNAHTVGFHNNNYRMGKRKQGEDRFHRIGQKHPVLYGDMVCPGSRDEKAIRILQKKHRVSEEVLGDAPKEWL